MLWKGSPRLRYYVPFIVSDVSVKNAIAYAYLDSLMAVVSTEPSFAAAKAVKRYGPVDEDVENKDRENGSEMGNYITASDIPEKLTLRTSLVLSAVRFCVMG